MKSLKLISLILMSLLVNSSCTQKTGAGLASNSPIEYINEYKKLNSDVRIDGEKSLLLAKLKLYIIEGKKDISEKFSEGGTNSFNPITDGVRVPEYFYDVGLHDRRFAQHHKVDKIVFNKFKELDNINKVYWTFIEGYDDWMVNNKIQFEINKREFEGDQEKKLTALEKIKNFDYQDLKVVYVRSVGDNDYDLDKSHFLFSIRSTVRDIGIGIKSINTSVDTTIISPSINTAENFRLAREGKLDSPVVIYPKLNPKKAISQFGGDNGSNYFEAGFIITIKDLTFHHRKERVSYKNGGEFVIKKEPVGIVKSYQMYNLDTGELLYEEEL